jgi:hypothetical protein
MLILLPRQIRTRSLPDLLQSIDPGVAPARGNRARLDKTVGFIDSLLRYRIFQRYGKCLLRSLVLFKFLRAEGWPVEIHFGVRRLGDGENVCSPADTRSGVNSGEPSDTGIGITGHSWLVMDGETFLENGNSSFTRTYSYPEN